MARDELILAGIGASAGGLEAIERFFAAVSPRPRVSYVVVQHLAPDHHSRMAELLSPYTSLPVREVEDGQLIEPQTIHLLPRKANLTVFNGRLFLADPEPGLNLPIDILFRSLAEAYGDRAAAVVLSGTGSDGARGVRAVKDAGGLVLVQSSASATFDGMPESAIQTGIVDQVLVPEEMPAAIMRFAQGRSRLARVTEAAHPDEDTALSRILLLLKEHRGIDLSTYKPRTVIKQVERRMAVLGTSSLEEYLTYLQRHQLEVGALFKDILIGVTSFFRDPDSFEALRTQTLPQLVRHAGPDHPLRVWVPACSSGEEAYSIAILIAEYLEEHDLELPVRIFATDVDGEAIRTASAGIYPESIAADASAERMRRYFTPSQGAYQVAPGIREWIVFAHHNAITDPPFRRMDLVSCRNLLIYLRPEIQQQVLANFAFAIRPGGWLFLGDSETVGDHTRTFQSPDVRWKLFQHTAHDTASEGSSGGREPVLAPDPPRPRSRRQPAVQTADDVELFSRIVHRTLAPAVIVTPDGRVQRVIGDVSDYMRLPEGRMDPVVTRLVDQSLAIPLGNALAAAVRSGSPAITPVISIPDPRSESARAPADEDPAVGIAAHARVYPLDIAHAELLLISFAGQDYAPGDSETTGAAITEFTVEEGVRQRIRDLEEQLQRSEENLQATVEELETSNEELQATNEELLSSNEELQSTNEELHSVNQELITVNAEYQKKIEQLSRLNDDVNNLLAASPVGTIFLDAHLRVRKFTPDATRHFRLIADDVGRPITDLSHQLEYDRFPEDLERVRTEGRPSERRVTSRDGHTVLVRILPYAEDDGSVSGTVIGLVELDPSMDRLGQ